MFTDPSSRPRLRPLPAAKRPFAGQAAGNHEIWQHPATNRYTTIPPNHPGDMPEGTLRTILKQAGIEPEVFLQKK